MAEDFDRLFGGSTGLADDFDGVIRNPMFRSDPSRGDGAFPLLVVDFETDDPEVGTLEEQFIGIGKKGMEAADGGKRVEGMPSGGFNRNTHAQTIISRLRELDEGLIRERYNATEYRPDDIRFWDGLKCHWNSEEFHNKINDEDATWSWLLPTKFYGWEDGAAPAKAAAKSAKKASKASKSTAKAAKKAAPAEKAESGLTAEIAAQIRKIADESDDEATFVERAYAEVEGVEASAEIQAAIDDTESEDSIWQQAVAAFNAG